MIFDGLTGVTLVLAIICVLAVCVFEFVNGFHDTANAVATVIYTRSLKPTVAVLWSGFWNFIGVLLGMGVAMSILKLIPLSDMMLQPLGDSIALVLAILLTAIIWNLGTWYYGIPCSSSHTLIGSLLGGGMVFYWLHGGEGVNWDKAKEIGLSLLISPMFGFSLAIIMMYTLRQILRTNKDRLNEIFKEPTEDSRPPLWIRAILVLTCTLVSFFHGSNDGQKGIALMLVVLISFMPMKYALQEDFNPETTKSALVSMKSNLRPTADIAAIDKLIVAIDTIKVAKTNQTVYAVRNGIVKLGKKIDKELKAHGDEMTSDQKAVVKKSMATIKQDVESSPGWVPVVIAICLGVGTTIGWKRIVVTIGEKIGKRHMTYAEGACAEMMAASTIGLSTGLGLPVSTTHVLSSGVAGSMVASKGVKNLQADTIKTIALAWILTLPVTIVMAGGLYWVFVKMFV